MTDVAPLRGSVWWFRYLEDEDPKPVVVVSNDGRNRSSFPWVHVCRITTRPKRALPTVVELLDADAPLTGRVMVDDLELVHKDDLEGPPRRLSPATLRDINRALRTMLDLG